MFKNRYLIIISILLILIALILVAIFYLRNNTTNQNTANTQAILPSNISENLLSETEIPRDNTNGVHMTSPVVNESKKSIEILSLRLPYENRFTSKDGIEVEVNIQSATLELQNYVLYIDIWGPDYQIPDDDPEYEKNKNAFLEGASDALTYIKNQDVEPSSIIIEWGTRALIRETAQKWLVE